jgi:hypothetical protein
VTENLADRCDGYVLREQLKPADLSLSSGPNTVPLLLTANRSKEIYPLHRRCNFDTGSGGHRVGCVLRHRRVGGEERSPGRYG